MEEREEARKKCVVHTFDYGGVDQNPSQEGRDRKE